MLSANHLPKKEITKKPWITKETIETIEKRKTAKQKNGYSTTEYREAQKHVKQRLKRDKKDFLHQKLFDIETSQAKLKHKKMFEGINILTKKFTPRLSVIKDKHNKVLTDSEEISRRWTEYCTEMYDGPITKNGTDGPKRRRTRTLRSEVKWAINQLPLGKSAGNDAIHGEMIKASGEEGISIHHKLCTKIWKEEKWPSEWTKAVFVPIPKKGDFQQCTNYRTIALISHASKILLKITRKRLRRKLDEEINQTQSGFRQNRGTRDQIFNLRMPIEKCREANINLHMCFIDYSKAFDCVGHREMIKALKKMNCHYKITNLVINLYKEQLAAVRLESGFLLNVACDRAAYSPLPYSACTQRQSCARLRQTVNSPVLMQ